MGCACGSAASRLKDRGSTSDAVLFTSGHAYGRYTGSLKDAYNVRGKYLTAQKAAQLDDGVDLNPDPNDLDVGPDAKYRRSQHLADTPTFDDRDAYAAPGLPDGDDTTTTAYGGGQDCTRAGSPKKTRLYPKKALIGGIMAAGSAATQAVGSALKRVLTHDVGTVDTDGKVLAPQDAYGKQLDALVLPKPRCRTSGKIASSFNFAARGVLAAARATDEEMKGMAEMEGDSAPGPGAAAERLQIPESHQMESRASSTTAL